MELRTIMKKPGKPELHDLSKDRNTMKNVAATFPELVQKMKQLHAEMVRY
jgi:hypothetical protein